MASSNPDAERRAQELKNSGIVRPSFALAHDVSFAGLNLNTHTERHRPLNDDGCDPFYLRARGAPVQHASSRSSMQMHYCLCVTRLVLNLQTTGLPAPLAGDNAIPIKGTAVPNKDVRPLLFGLSCSIAALHAINCQHHCRLRFAARLRADARVVLDVIDSTASTKAMDQLCRPPKAAEETIRPPRRATGFSPPAAPSMPAACRCVW